MPSVTYFSPTCLRCPAREQVAGHPIDKCTIPQVCFYPRLLLDEWIHTPQELGHSLYLCGAICHITEYAPLRDDCWQLLVVIRPEYLLLSQPPFQQFFLSLLKRRCYCPVGAVCGIDMDMEPVYRWPLLVQVSVGHRPSRRPLPVLGPVRRSSCEEARRRVSLTNGVMNLVIDYCCLVWVAVSLVCSIRFVERKPCQSRMRRSECC